MAARPGSPKIGRIIFTSRQPKNSSKPKSKRSGKNKPAKRKIENKTGSKSLNTRRPVSEDVIISTTGNKRAEITSPFSTSKIKLMGNIKRKIPNNEGRMNLMMEDVEYESF